MTHVIFKISSDKQMHEMNIIKLSSSIWMSFTLTSTNSELAYPNQRFLHIGLTG